MEVDAKVAKEVFEHLVHHYAHPHTFLVQVKIAQRIGLIQHLPTGNFDGCKKNRE